jgi:hypothetical protein
MNYKNELEKYLNNSNIKLNKNDITNTTIINQTQQLEESIVQPPRYYSKVVEECLNFEEVNTKKVKYNKLELQYKKIPPRQ